MPDRNLQLLGLAKKAGLVAVGADAVYSAARAGKTWLIITACDASGGALRRAKASADAGGAECITVPYTQFELGNATGRGSPGTVAVLDVGFAAGFARGLANNDPEHYNATAERLEEKARAINERKKQALSGKRRTEQ